MRGKRGKCGKKGGREEGKDRGKKGETREKGGRRGNMGKREVHFG